jgi:hypothetical protein
VKHIIESLKSEFVSVDDDGKRYVVRTWHVLVAVFVIGWLIG